MKKLYETPLCESLNVTFQSPLLTGSGGDFGEAGMAGNDLDILDEFLF